jgi:lipid A 3-O-deacylase
MTRQRTYLLIACIALLQPLPVLAWPGEAMQTFIERGRPTTVIDIDNDTLLLTGSDRFYTSGLRLSRSYRMRGDDGWESLGWRIGQQLYTASSIQRRPEQLAALDHPYAGWIYAGLFHRREAGDGSEIAYGLDIGCLGPCAGGEWTQNGLHRLLHQPRPAAWSTQIGTEAGLVVLAGARGPYWLMGEALDLRPGVAARLGNIFTDLSAEATLRAGELRGDARHISRYGFLRVAARVVGHDATLQGGWLHGTEARTVSPKRLTGEAELGVQWQAAQWALRVSVVRRDNEIRGLSDTDGRQEFLRLSIAFTR